MTADMRVLPDYIIVGGKRCGSTSLQSWLSNHPSVVSSHSGKGTHYFDENYYRGEDWFRGHYPLALMMTARARMRKGPVVTGEASPYYSVHPAALNRIAERLPHVKLIFVLREPVARAYSHWVYECRRKFESLDIHAALDAEPERLAGEVERMMNDPTYVSWNHRHYTYVTRGIYADQLDRCLMLFRREQVLVLEFAELFGRKSSAPTRICDFLGIDPINTDLPRLEIGSTDGSVPADVRTRLHSVFSDSNRRVRERFGLELG